MDRLRLEPAEGTLEGYGLEGAVHFYESSLRDPDGDLMVSIASKAKGMRMTRDQVRALRDWLEGWLDETSTW